MFVELGTEKQPARPYLRPGFENTKLQQLEAFKVEFRKRLDSAVKKAKR